MKKDIIIGALLLILGCIIGLIIRPDHFCDSTKMLQIDTVYATKYYSRLELVSNTYKLDIPKIGCQEYVYVAADSATVIYKDSIKYVMLPREYYYTSMDDVEIWHSGIDSTIDSLNVFKKNMVISKTETTTQSVTMRNTLAFGFEMQYNGTASIPIYLEYSHLLHKNVEMSGKVIYDFPSKNICAGMGIKVLFGW